MRSVEFMEGFYKKYNLNKYYFAEFAHVGTKSLVKYAKGEKLRPETVEQIELAIRVTEKYDLVRPAFDNNFFLPFNKWHEDMKKYKENFEMLLNKEKAL